MRVKLIATLAVLILSTALCLLSMQYIFGKIETMERFTSIVHERVDAGDLKGARETLAQMAEDWERDGDLLRAITPHEDLHSVTVQYVEATSNLESGNMDNFERAMALLTETLNHLRERESLSWANIL